MLQSAYPYFGGKQKVADLVWSKFGKVHNFVDPFLGSGAMLLRAPEDPTRVETINDLDNFVMNFFRAVKYDPLEVAKYADYPIHETQLNQNHQWLKSQRDYLQEKIAESIESYDVKVAGIWAHGINCWIGSGFCGNGKNNQKPYLSSAGQGLFRIDTRDRIPEYLTELSNRLRRVRVLCGDWTRCLSHSVTTKVGLTGIFLDPPYTDYESKTKLYTNDEVGVAKAVKKWAIENGNNPKVRIAYCGYSGNNMIFPSDWQEVHWKAGNGYSGQRKEGTNENSHRETIWFSPHCVQESDSDCLITI